MKRIALIAALALVAAPMAAADHGGDHGDPPDAANFGLCTAQDASEDGDENSNGTVSETPPFSSLDEEDCEDAEPPSGPGDTPAPDNPGDDEQPEDPGDDNSPDNPGDDNRRDKASLGFLP